jgi:thiol-disulfide isomerase/thioredoxin
MIFGSKTKIRQDVKDLKTESDLNNKFYNEAVTNRKILFFTQKGCVPCLKLKPTCEALARQNDYVFQEVDIRTDPGKILMTQYKIGATPEVVLIDGNITKQWGAADLFEDKLALYLTPPKEPDSDLFDDGKPPNPANAQTDSNWIVPVGAGAVAFWYFNRRKKRIGNPDDNQKIWMGAGLLLLLWWLTKGGKGKGRLSSADLEWMMNLSMKNEGPWEAENSHTRQDSGNYHKGNKNGQFLGTSYGITADFLEHWYGITSFKADSIRNITEAQAKKYFSETVMVHARVPEVKDKYVAALYFDWMMQRPGTCLEYLMTKMFKLSQSDFMAAKRGYYSKSGVTDNVIALLNQGDAKECFEKLKGWRLHHLENTSVYASFREGVRKRINRYEYGK